MRRWLKEVGRELRLAQQRVDQGWDVEGVWSLDYTLCRTLGEQLRFLAEHVSGWPHHVFAEPEDWQAALGAASFALLNYDASCFEQDFDTTAEEAAYVQNNVEEAQEALRWIADHLTLLWD